METKGKKIIKHPFYDKHTILGSIVLMVLSLIITQILFGTIGGEIYCFISGTRDYHSAGYTTGLNLGVIVGAVILLAIFKRWFYPEYEGAFKGGKNVPRWCILSAAIPAALLIYNLISDPSSVSMPPLVNLVAALMAGVCEETIYRGVIASYLMRQTVAQKKILPTMLVSSLLFALIHIIFLCALFLRSGSLIPGMIFHALYDIVAFTDTTNIGEGGVFKPTATVTLEDQIFSMVLRAIYLAIAIYMTRPSVREEIYEIWSKKWHKNVEENITENAAENTEVTA